MKPITRIFILCVFLNVKVWANEQLTLLVPQTGHSAAINHLTYSPSGELIASSSEDNSVRVWSQEGTIVSLLDDGHSAVVQSVFLDESNLITLNRNGVAYLWDILTQSRIKVADLNGIVPMVGKDLLGLAKKKSVLAIAGYRSVHWAALPKGWLGEQPLKLEEIRVNFNVDAIAVSPSGQYIAAANREGYLYIYDTKAKAEIYRQILDPLFTRVKFESDQSLLLAGRGVLKFDLPRLALNSKIESNSIEPVEAIDVNPTDGTIVAIAEQLNVYNNHDNSIDLSSDEFSNNTVEFSPLGQQMAVVKESSAECYAQDSQILILDLKGKILKEFSPGFSSSPKTAYSAEGTLAINSCSQRIQLWDAVKKSLIKSSPRLPIPVAELGFDPEDPAKLFIKGIDNSLYIWDSSKRKKALRKLWQGDENDTVTWSLHIKKLAYSRQNTDGTFSVFIEPMQVPGQRLMLPKSFVGKIDTLLFSPSANMLTVKTSADGILVFSLLQNELDKKTDVANNNILGRIGLNDISLVDYAFNPVNERVAIAYEDRIELWSSQSLSKVNVVPTKYAGINKIQFNEDGSHLAVIARRKVIVFDSNNLTVLRELDGVSAINVHFSQNDTNLILVKPDAELNFLQVAKDYALTSMLQNINQSYGYAYDYQNKVLSVAKQGVYQPILLKKVKDNTMVFESVQFNQSPDRKISNLIQD